MYYEDEDVPVGSGITAILLSLPAHCNIEFFKALCNSRNIYCCWLEFSIRLPFDTSGTIPMRKDFFEDC